IYNAARSCIFEGEILHNRPHFEQLNKRIIDLVQKDGQVPAIVFEATGVYSRPLERFMNDHGFPYCLLNPLESKIQTATMRIHKTDKSDAHNRTAHKKTAGPLLRPNACAFPILS
ncbi:transposase, partial [Aeribacillus composti]|uniref:IS110 family transposase n=1 Tax=Aeribacillus composti TaxID=1868734 RepID=UPI002E1FB29F|nr:transposase [Aeribacillus composti]